MLWNIERYNQITILSLKGTLNGATVAGIEDQVLSQIVDGQRVLLDLSGVQYMSSAAIRFLLSLYRAIRERSGAMALSGLSEELADVLSMTGFLDLFRTYKDRSMALALM
jgi:anti-sigma B factor antagonist